MFDHSSRVRMATSQLPGMVAIWNLAETSFSIFFAREEKSTLLNPTYSLFEQPITNYSPRITHTARASIKGRTKLSSGHYIFYCLTGLYVEFCEKNVQVLVGAFPRGALPPLMYRGVDASRHIDLLNDLLTDVYTYFSQLSCFANIPPQASLQAPSPPQIERYRVYASAPPAPLEPSAPPAYPNERVAISLARDFIAQKEVCPITQDQIVGNKVAVTLCNCVFQANCLVEWAAKHSTCPACRTDLTFRIVTV